MPERLVFTVFEATAGPNRLAVREVVLQPTGVRDLEAASLIVSQTVQSESTKPSRATLGGGEVSLPQGMELARFSASLHSTSPIRKRKGGATSRACSTHARSAALPHGTVHTHTHVNIFIHIHTLTYIQFTYMHSHNEIYRLKY